LSWGRCFGGQCRIGDEGGGGERERERWCMLQPERLELAGQRASVSSSPGLTEDRGLEEKSRRGRPRSVH
jgi:hypothetical protein